MICIFPNPTHPYITVIVYIYILWPSPVPEVFNFVCVCVHVLRYFDAHLADQCLGLHLHWNVARGGGVGRQYISFVLIC